MPTLSPEDRQALVRDKYEGTADEADLEADTARLAAGEPLAYVIGWVPFLGLRIELDSRALIPRPETEFWTEQLIVHLQERFGTKKFRLLDLCAGSGAIGLAVLKALPGAHISFAELDESHAASIRDSLAANGLDESRADIRTGDLFAPFADETFDVIATNPPYIPAGRSLPESVADFEPHPALFSGPDGLDLIRRIAAESRSHLTSDGELWLEADISNIQAAAGLLIEAGFSSAAVHTDQYGRERFIVAH